MSRWNHLNVGTVDRTLRAVLGLAAIAYFLSGPGALWGYVVAFMLLLTAAIGFCPLYALSGLSTRGRRTS
jgi:hypothetical protein